MSAKPGLPCIAASPAPDLGPPSGRQQDKVTGREGTGLEIEAWGPGGERLTRPEKGQRGGAWSEFSARTKRQRQRGDRDSEAKAGERAAGKEAVMEEEGVRGPAEVSGLYLRAGPRALGR